MMMSAPIRAAEISVKGRTISHARGGEGPDHVLLHGFGADRTTWMFTLPLLAGIGRFFAPDLPGHGGSSLDVGTGDVPFLADIVLDYLDALAIDSAHFVGHSLGGAIALQLASAHPRRVSALTLIAPAGLGDTINRDFIDRFIALGDPEEALATLSLLVARPAMIGAQMARDVLAFVTRPGVGESLRKIADASFPEGRQRYLYRDVIETLDVPVQVVWGGRDRILVPWSSTSPKVPVHVFAEAGHLAHMEVPQKVSRLIARSAIPSEAQ
jgi:pyruvate dehydrogenase E2 component (dihydrolipoamide acetyltransferase)